jgi:CRP/FNR family transcriptional regulator
MFQLKDIPMFSGLREEQLEKLQADVYIHHYSKGSILFYEGDESDYLQILLDGAVKLYKTSPNGAQLHMHNFVAPIVVGYFASFEKIPFPATCEFITDGTIGLLPMKKFDEYLQDADFSRSLVSLMAKRMQMYSDVLHKETIYSSVAKIADLIYKDASIFKSLKNTEIAETLNITPETLSRTLSKLKKENIITIDNHIVTILNEEALLNIIETNKI